MIRLSLSSDPAIRRRPDGSIDTASYIARGRALRAEQATDLLRAAIPALSGEGAVGPGIPYPFSRRTLPAR